MWILLNIFMFIFMAILLYKLFYTKRKIKEILEILKDKKEEKNRQHFLINTNDDIVLLTS